MADDNALSKLVPGFDFLQGLVKQAGSAIPGMGQWIAPTLDPAELDKRIEELKTVQFWLEQNARMLAATIQALEVQRMTLSTLKSMNMPVAQVAEAFKFKTPPASGFGGFGSAVPAAASPAARDASPFGSWGSPASAPPASPEPAASAASAPAAKRKRPAAKRSAPASAAPSGDSEASPMADPMQWWGALTQQFSQLAAQALKEGGSPLARAAGAVKAAQEAVSGTGKVADGLGRTKTGKPASKRASPSQAEQPRRSAKASRRSGKAR